MVDRWGDTVCFLVTLAQLFGEIFTGIGFDAGEAIDFSMLSNREVMVSILERVFKFVNFSMLRRVANVFTFSAVISTLPSSLGFLIRFDMKARNPLSGLCCESERGGLLMIIGERLFSKSLV